MNTSHSLPPLPPVDLSGLSLPSSIPSKNALLSATYSPHFYDPTYPSTPVPESSESLHSSSSSAYQQAYDKADEMARLLRSQGIITGDYEIDLNGLCWESLVRALSPKYDDPATGLPVFAIWAEDAEMFPQDKHTRLIKIGAAVLIVTLSKAYRKG